MSNTKALVVLIGEKTKNLHKFVRWEQEIALNMGIPIIAVNLNGLRDLDANLCPPIIRDETIVHVSFGSKIIKYALNNWPSQRQGCTGPRRYSDDIYNKL